MKRRSKKYVIGIDEVGRGALAGPVVVAAVCFPAGMKISNRELGALKDSKKLSPRKRELWREYFKTIPEILSRTARVYPRAIEKINISKAANRAANSAFENLVRVLELEAGEYSVFLDGGLYLESRENQSTLRRGSGRMIVKTIIQGDEKITAVKVASIIAKVQRDKYMEKLSKKHPRYGFEIHKGYGTKRHISSIKRYGSSRAHRLTFIKKWHNIHKH